MAVRDWDIISGDWSIVNNQLYEVGTVDAIIIDPLETQTWLITVDVPSVIENAAYRLIANYRDAANFYYAAFVFTSEQLTISIVKRTGGVDDVLETKSMAVSLIGFEVELRFCLAERAAIADVDYPIGYRVIKEYPVLHTNALNAGLGNGAAVAIYYDNYVHTEIDVPGCPTCPLCECVQGDCCSSLFFLSIINECRYHNLYAEFINHDCPGLDSGPFLLVASGAFCNEWLDTEPEQHGCPNFEIQVKCEPIEGYTGCYGIMLKLVPGPTFDPLICAYSPTDWVRPNTCTCDPFEVVFRGFQVYSVEPPESGGQCLCNCSTFDIKLTIAS